MSIIEFFGHLTYILIALSFLVRDILWLRCVSIVASVCSMIFVYNQPIPLMIVFYWNIVFIVINAVRIGLLIREKLSVKFSEEERELFETMFRGFSPVEFMKLMRVGAWSEVGQGQVLASEGRELEALALIYNGQAAVTVGGREVTQLKDGHFVGEMSFATRGPASATVETTAPTRLLTWSREELNKLLGRNPSIRLSLQGVLGENMARKLQEQAPAEEEGDGLS